MASCSMTFHLQVVSEFDNWDAVDIEILRIATPISIMTFRVVPVSTKRDQYTLNSGWQRERMRNGSMKDLN